MRKLTDNFNRNSWIGYSMVLMLLSLFLSRAALSVSMMLFFALTLFHKDVGKQFMSFLNNKFLLFFSLLFWIPFVSGLWSADLLQWQHVVVIKLPLLLFPLAFAGSWKLSERGWQHFSLFFILIVVAGSGWSLLQYLFHTERFHEAYLQARLITTPLENDHVRFSWLVAVAIITAVLIWPQQKERRLLLGGVIIFLAIYLHVLAARMGLACFYLFCIILVLVKFKSLAVRFRYLIGAVVILLPVLAWLLLPTFQNRQKYFRYDITQTLHSRYEPGSNDGARLLSMRAGVDLLLKNPVGVGAGDVAAASQQWFNENEPDVIEADRFPPMNEWLMYGGFAGWPGVLLFSIAVLYSFFWHPQKNRFFWWVLNAFVVFSYLFDMALEVQYGVFLYSFILLWWYKWLKPQ